MIKIKKGTLQKPLQIVLASVFFFFLLMTHVQALGVAPSSYSINYEENDEQQLNLRVLNTDGKAKRILLRVQGEYSFAVELPQYYVDFKVGETSKTVSYTLTHPANLPSGNHKIDVVLVELPSDATGGTMITVSTTVIQKITLFSPYDGSFISGTVYVDEADVSQPITFTVRATNKGTQLTTLSGEVIVKGSSNNEIVRVPLTTRIVEVGASTKLVGVFSGLDNPGMYIAETLLFYDNKNIQLTKNFQVGAVNIRPLSLDVEQFILGEIVRVNLEVQSDWNQDVGEVYAIIDVLDGVGSKVTSFQTMGTTTLGSTIPARQRKTLEAFWDTASLDIGTYDLLVTVYYAGKTSEKIFTSVVGIDELQVINNQLSGKVTGKTGDDGNSYTFLIILILGLIGVNAGVLIYLSKKKKK